VPDNQALDRELSDAGIPHVFELYQGGHNATLWHGYEDQWLAAAVERLEPPERGGS
jgi:enterochelin esterase-like enzyme